jgi:hypothetical protein
MSSSGSRTRSRRPTPSTTTTTTTTTTVRSRSRERENPEAQHRRARRAAALPKRNYPRPRRHAGTGSIISSATLDVLSARRPGAAGPVARRAPAGPPMYAGDAAASASDRMPPSAAARRRRRPSGAARRFAPPRVRAAAEAASAASFDGEAEATQTARHVTRRQPAPPLRMTAPSPPIRVSISQASAFFYFAAAARRAVHARRAIYGRCLRHALFRPALLCCAALLRSRGDGSAVLSSPRAGPATHPGCALWRWQAAALPDAMSLRRAWREGGPAGGRWWLVQPQWLRVGLSGASGTEGKTVRLPKLWSCLRLRAWSHHWAFTIRPPPSPLKDVRLRS